MERYSPRQEAYRYIRVILNKRPVGELETEWVQTISLEELRQLKEGIADPSVSLVTSLKKLLIGTVTESGPCKIIMPI